MTNFLKWTLGNALLKIPFWKNTLLKKYTLKNILLKKKYFWKILLFTVQWSRVMRTGIGKWWSFAAATIKGGSCPSISWKPMSTSSNILCLSTFKTSPGKYSYESWVERAAKVVKFIKSVGRLVGWLDVTFPAEELEKMAKVDEYMLLQQLVSSDI